MSAAPRSVAGFLGRWTVAGAVVLCIAVAASTASAQGLSRSGRWFAYDGQPVFLVGFDCQEIASDPSVDYVAALDAFVDQRINKVRIWIYTWFGGAQYLSPWDRSQGAHDLDAWNDAYWARLRDFAEQARARGIVVEVTVFAPYPDGAWWWSEPAFQLAWNRDFNVNGAFSTNASGHFMPEFFDLAYAETTSSSRTLGDYQAALVDKAVAELGGYENVYFEVCNEFGAPDVERWSAWQRHFASRIDAAALTTLLTSAVLGFNLLRPLLVQTRGWNSRSDEIVREQLVRAMISIARPKPDRG